MDSLRDLVALDAVFMAEHNQEFVTAEPPHDIAVTDRVDQDLCRRDDGRIANFMTEVVVQRLQAIQVDEEHGDRLTIQPSPADVDREVVEHGASVEQTGQPVMRGGIMQLLAVYFSLLDALSQMINRGLQSKPRLAWKRLCQSRIGKIFCREGDSLRFH